LVITTTARKQGEEAMTTLSMGSLSMSSVFNNATYNSIADVMLPNTTTSFWHEFHEISQYNLQLNYFERLWAAWYAFMGNDVLATGLMIFIMHEVVYFGRSLPWIIIDQIPAMNKYKIQNVSTHHEQ
jgi:methylsterol monooxygenase